MDNHEQEYEAALIQWAPKINRMARSYIPYHDYDDVAQELKLILFKCLKQFDPTKGVTFHTYLHRAMVNRLGRLKEQMSSPIQGPRKGGKHNPPPNSLVYFEGHPDLDDEPRESSTIESQLSTEFEESFELHLRMLGYETLEIYWMAGKVVNLTVAEIASLAQVPVADVRQASITAKAKSKEIREEELHYASYH